MSQITKVHLVPIQGAYYYEDVAALQGTSSLEADRWFLPAKTAGFNKVREIAEGVSVGIELESGEIHWGDCVSVSYAGKAGRKELFRSDAGVAALKKHVVPGLVNQSVKSFRQWDSFLENTDWHPAIRYGTSQALLSAAASTQKVSMMELICREWKLPVVNEPLALQGSSGNDRHSNADKMIVNRLEALPHTQVDDIATQLGEKGEILVDYAQWLVQRISVLADRNYKPVLHFDVHGSIGIIFGQDSERIKEYLLLLEKTCLPYAVRVESAVMRSTRDEQIQALAEIKQKLETAGSRVKLVADEWANTKEDILAFANAKAASMVHVKMPDLGSLHESIETVIRCKTLGIEVLLGGSCIETEISTKASVHLGLALRPEIFLTKPGMGVNEAIMLVRNEMMRTLASLRTS